MTRTERVHFRTTKNEKEMIAKQAEKAGETITDYILRLVENDMESKRGGNK